MSAYSVKIKCGSCDRNKAQEFFSKTSLAKFRESQRKHAANSKNPIKTINCTACNAGGRDELECSGCNRVMALEKFNKTQRRKNDNALCQDCSQEKIDREPEHAKEVQEIAIIDELKKMEIGEYSQHSSRLSSAARSRLASTDRRLETDTNPGSDTGSWFAGNDAVSLVGSENSAYSSTATRPKTGTGWDGFAGANRSNTTSQSGSNAGFAKQNAVPRDQFEKAHAQYQREQRRAQEQEEIVRDDSDDSDDDDDEPY